MHRVTQSVTLHGLFVAFGELVKRVESFMSECGRDAAAWLERHDVH